MEVKPGYKQTEVGAIPEEWEVVTAGEVGRFRGGNGFPLIHQGETNGAYPFFKVSDMNNEGNEIFITSANHRISEGTRKQLGATAFPAGSIVLAKVGAAIFLERKKILGQPSCIDNNMTAFVLDSSRADVRFVHTLLLTTKLGSLVSTTALPSLNGKQLGEIRLRLPPLPEQRAIAAALSDVDGLLGGLDRLIAKKRDLKQAAMQQLLTGQTRLPGFHGNWEVKRLGSLLRFQVGFPFSSAFFNEKGEGIRLVKNRDLKSDDQVFHYNGKYEESFVVRDGDVLIGMDGDFLPCQWNKGPALLNQRVGRVVPNAALNVAFAFYALIEPLKEIEIVTSSTTVKHLSHGDVEGIERPLPELPEQTAIAEVLSEMDGELAVLEQRREKTRALKQAMMQELLSGRTRLPVQ